MLEGIIVAVIGLIGVVLASLIQTTRKENKSDHAQVMDAVVRIETKIDTHIADHARGQIQNQKQVV